MAQQTLLGGDGVTGETGATHNSKANSNFTELYTATAAAQSTADSANTGLSNHISDPTAAHAGTAISFDAGGSGLSSTDVNAAIIEVAASAGVADATDTTKGIVELATNAETLTGTDTVRATTPAGVKAVADTKASLTGAETLTNKRITPRVQSVASAGTVTPSADADDAVKITAQAASLILANPSGTPTSMQALLLRLKDNGTVRSISWGSQYRGIGLTLPTVTVVSKTMYFGLVWNSDDTKWDVVGYSVE